MAEPVRKYSYTPGALTELTICLSTSRFQPYRRRANNDEVLAMESYLFNSRVSKSLLYPLNVCEIALRNAANDVLKADFSQAWHRNPSFTNLLVPKTRDALAEAVRNTRSSNVDDVVAELNFGFWFHLFRSIHFPLWQNRFPRVVRAKPAVAFTEFEPRLKRISSIRNRIAHHEGVLALPQPDSASAVYADIVYIVEAISQEAADWLRAHATLNRALRSKPAKNGIIGTTVGERSDDRFEIVKRTTPLSALNPQIPSIVVHDNKVRGAISGRELAEFFFAAMDSDTLIAVNEHTAGDLIDALAGPLSFTELQEGFPLGDLHTQISKKRYAIVVSEGGTPTGVIAAAHRRY